MTLNDSQGTAINTPPLTLSSNAPPSSSATSTPASSATVSPSNSTTTSLTTAPTSITDNNSSSSKDHDDTRKTEAPPKKRSKNGYVARVGFDTLDCEATAQYAFTLQARTDHWHRTKYSRTFLVGTDLNDYSAHALQWVMENMVEDGDEIVALRVVPIELRDSFAKSGIPSFQGQELAAREEAAKLMGMIREKNKSKELNIIVECLVGNVRDTIQHMIKMYEPDMLVVGTRGRNTVKGFLLGSVSRYCLNHSPVPVTVVRPASKLIKSKTKAKGIFRRRTSTVQSDLEEDSSSPQLFYSSPLSRQTSRSSLDPAITAEIEREESRSPELEHDRHHRHSEPTAATKASAAKRSSLFSAPAATVAVPTSGGGIGAAAGPNGMASMDPAAAAAASIHSSLNYASALLSSSPPDRMPPPPEGMIRLTKSLTTDGTTGPTASHKKMSGRRSFARLSPSVLLGPLSLGAGRKKPAS
ncbi:hypothetical protein BC939DRAFT_441661 [Gamsiella multidivaricata]|uniref:uncharacterized protein n=1 Tax=Gamsiella multidivaricata TaxID=101098 RepID=UPI00221F333D|nr:uncharacterized protein BC939DRAFT_441661 [Gamsiella multidivaricata]KAG0369723.1 hypothetical protein BGZ54_009070 [Gamsiella multidivaricata]KAI7829359.1 hypothetical protein BC939DRAFT_441661 [Gamsiella multidivaricata]